VLALAVTVLLLQSVSHPLAVPARPGPRLPGPPEPLRALRVGLDTLYGGDFRTAADYFAALAAREPTDPAPLVFQAGAYIWWASAKDSSDFALQRIDSLLGAAMARARALPAGSGDFWLATALGYRARQREEHGHGYAAAKDAKVMRDIYRRLLAADSTCIDCYLGLGVYDYGLARAGAVSRFFARIIGLGSGDAGRGIGYMRRVARDGDLARVESAWVLAAALLREAARDERARAALQTEARGYVETLAARYPANPVFQRFLRELPATRSSAREPVGAPARPAAAAVPLAPVGRGNRRELAEHVVDVALHRVGGDVEPLRDFFVAQAGRDQVSDFLLALGQAHRASGLSATGTRAADDVFRTGDVQRSRWWRQVRAARHGTNRLHDVLGGRVLHDEPVGAAVDELIDVLLRGNEVHDYGFGVGRARLQVAEERVAVTVRESRIEQDDLRLGVAHLLRCGVGVVGARDDVHVGKCREQAREPIAHQTIIFENENTNACCRHGRAAHATVTTTAPVQRTITITGSIIEATSARRRDASLDTADCPRHTPPPFLGLMYFLSRTSGIPRGDEIS